MTRTPASSRRGGFTLVELLVVIAIILVLLGLIAGVGVVVMEGQRISATQSVLLTLDRALEEYMALNDGHPPKYDPLDYVGVPGPGAKLDNIEYFWEYPAGTGRRHPLRPDAAVFLRQVMGYGEVRSIVSGIGDRFLRVTTTPAGTTMAPQGSEWDRDTDPTPSVLDIWAEPNWPPEKRVEPEEPVMPWSLIGQQVIYYVHPENLLAQQFYGRCESRRPYFMSAGPDKFYGVETSDNGQRAIIDHHGMQRRRDDPPPPIQDILRKAREDNLYSYPVKKDHQVDPSLLPSP